MKHSGPAGLVTIGIPTFNRVAMLSRAATAALQQSYAPLELVISDNASRDGTAAWCKSAAESDPRVRYFRNDTNVGHAANFRLAFERGRGEFFMWLADDDWVDRDYVQRCVERLCAEPSSVLVSGTCHFYSSGRYAFDEQPSPLVASDPADRVLAHFRTVVRNGRLSGVFRRGFLAVEPFPDVYAGDWLVVAGAAFRGPVLTVPEVALHRSLEGLSSNMAVLAESFGLKGLAARYGGAAIVHNVFVHIAFRSAVYAPIPRWRRVALGSRSAFVLARRFAVDSLRHQIGRITTRFSAGRSE